MTFISSWFRVVPSRIGGRQLHTLQKKEEEEEEREREREREHGIGS